MQSLGIKQLLSYSMNCEKLPESVSIKSLQPRRFLYKSIFNIEYEYLKTFKIYDNLKVIIDYLQFITNKSIKNKGSRSNKRSSSSKDLRSDTINSSVYNRLIQEKI